MHTPVPDAAPADAPTAWAPSGTLTIDTVASHWAELRSRLASGRGLDADLSAITRVDTAGLQLLWYARRTAERAGQPVCIRALALGADVSALTGVNAEAAVAAGHVPARAGEEG